MPTGTSLERYASDPSDGGTAPSHPRNLHESLLAQAAVALETHGNHSTALDGVLGAALRHLQWEDGWLIGLKGQEWRVLASRGRGLPIETRVTDQGAMRAIEDTSGLPSMCWRAHDMPNADQEKAGGLDVFIPLRFNRRTVGLLVLMGAADAMAPSMAQLASLHTLGVMLGAALLASAQPLTPDGGMIELLTPRERQVFALLPHGLTNIAIAKRLNIAPGTVKSHVERILHKLGFADRTQAAVYAARSGLDAI